MVVAVTGDRPPTGTVTFLFTDVVDSTQRWERDESGMARRLERHDEIARRCIAEAGGYVFSVAGDSFGAAFPSVDAALACAVAMQRELVHEVLPVRMGIHSGESQERAGNYYGSSVNRAARVMSIGHGGQILVSGTARSLLSGAAAETTLTSLGSFRLKGLEGRTDIWQATAPGLPQDFAPIDTGGQPGNLTAPVTSLIGREAQVADLCELVADRRLVTITGPSGMGKTRLATEIGTRSKERFDDGVWFVDLSAVADEAGVEAAIVNTLRLPATTSADAGVPGVVACRDALVILDNCEGALDAVADFVERALGAGAEARYLATSLAPLEVPGEQLVPLDGLDEDGAGVALFVDRARLADPGFDPGEDDLAAIASICRRLDGVPLALEMAAARVGMFTPAAIDERLADRFSLLVGSRRSSERHRTLLATVEWTVGMLPEDEQAATASLAVLSGSSTLDTIDRIAGADLVTTTTLDFVSDLSARSLLRPDSHVTGKPTYRLSETVRHFGRERLAETGRLDEVRRRHLDHFVAWADSRKAWHVAPMRVDHLEVRRLLGDLEAAFEEARRRDDADAAHRLVIGVANCICFVNPLVADRLLSELERWPVTVDPALVHRRELCRARYHQMTGSFFEVVERLERLVADPAVGDDVRPAAQNLLANTLAGDTDRARRIAEESREAFIALGDDLGIYDVDVTLAALDLYECDPQAALDRRLHRERGSLHGHFNQLGALVMVGDHVALRHELNLLDSRDQPLTFDYQQSMMAAFADALAGDVPAARAHLSDAVRLVRRTPVPLCAEECALAAAFVERHTGDPVLATEYLSGFRSSGPAPFRTALAIGLYRSLRAELAGVLGDAFVPAWTAGKDRDVDSILDAAFREHPSPPEESP